VEVDATTPAGVTESCWCDACGQWKGIFRF